MKVVYASRSGNVEKFVGKLDIEALKIVTGEEKVNEDYLLITYTDGEGIIPSVVKKFIENNRDHLKKAAVSGNMDRHPATYCGAADRLEKDYQCPVVARFHKDGDFMAVEAVKESLK